MAPHRKSENLSFRIVLLYRPPQSLEHLVRHEAATIRHGDCLADKRHDTSVLAGSCPQIHLGFAVCVVMSTRVMFSVQSGAISSSLVAFPTSSAICLSDSSPVMANEALAPKSWSFSCSFANMIV